MYKGIVVRNESLEPRYVVRFSYSNDNYYIKDATAIYLRQPNPKISFDDYTDYLLERLEIDEETVQHLRLEIGKTVCDFLLGNQRA